MAELDINVNSLLLGINMDDHPSLLQDGEYLYALNAVGTTIGNSPFTRNINGNSPCTIFPYGSVILNSLKISDFETIVFLVFPADKDIDNKKYSEIGIVSNCTYTKLCASYCLNFDERHPIKSIFKKNINCGRKVYWIDNYNVDRYIDIDNIPYINLGTECDPDYKGKILDCSKLPIYPNRKYPYIKVSDILYSGKLPAGAYQVAIQYCDKNGNGLGDYYSMTDPIPIYRDAIAQYFFTIEGSSPSTPTSKSIKYSISNIDTKFPLFNLAVIYTNNNQKTAKIVATLPTDTTEYVLSDIENGKDISIDAIVSRSKIYLTSDNITISNGYLLRNVTTERPTFNYQPYANNIQVKWVSKRVSGRNTTEDYKFPSTDKTLMRDEIYALGIYFIYKDGTNSPVYHIPGRKIDKRADSTNFIATTDQYGHAVNNLQWDSEHQAGCASNFDNYDDQFGITPRWKVYNTGNISGYHPDYLAYIANGGDPALYTGLYRIGEMAYWESSLEYPHDNDVYTGLCDSKIRHHKIPDCSIVPLHNNGGSYLTNVYLELLGIDVTNVVIPQELQDEIQGYKIVIGNPENNRTILGKGILYNMVAYDVNCTLNTTIVQFPAVSTTLYSNYPYNNVTDPPYLNSYDSIPVGDPDSDPTTRYFVYNSFAIYSPEFLFKSPALSINELKVEGNIYGHTSNSINTIKIFGLDPCYTIDFPTAPNISFNVADYNNYVKTAFGNVRRKIDESCYLPNNSTSTGITNTPINNRYKESTVYLGLKKDVLNNSNSNQIATTPIADTTTWAVNDRVASSYYGSCKVDVPSLYGNVPDIFYIGNGGNMVTDFTSNHVSSHFIGDTFINYLTLHRRHVWYSQKYTNIFNYCDLISDDVQAFDPTITPFDAPQWCYGVPGFWVESHMNIDLRVEEPDVAKYYWPNLKGNTIRNWLKYLGIDGDNSYTINDDYNILNKLYSLDTLPSYYIPGCDITYPGRVIYSEKSSNEETIDSWLIYKPLNYYDFPSQSGTLKVMEGIGLDKVIYIFENSLYIQPAYQTINTDINTIYLGNGSMFSPEPKELMTVDGGYAGSQHRLFFNTKFGKYWIDAKRGAIHQFGDNIDEISKNKMLTWFKANLKFKLLDQLPEYKYIDCPGYVNGLGFTGTFDNNTNLLFITKKDYKIKDGVSGIFINSDGELAKEIHEEGKSELVYLNDSRYFEVTSWTISYNPMTQRWYSFYSFLPYTYLNIANNYMTQLLGNNTGYIHNNKDKYNYFYDNNYQFIVEFPINNKQYPTTLLSSLYFKTYAYKEIDNNLVEDVNVTFTGAYVYNTEQCTGNLELVTQNQNNLSNILNSPIIGVDSVTIPISRQNSMWSISALTDRLNDLQSMVPMFITEGTQLLPQFPIDKIINNTAINYNKSWYELKPIKSSTSSVRLFFNNTDYMLLTSGLSAKKRQSIR